MSVQQTYLFYDIESSGLNKCFDQVLQFAAIRTDLNLNEIEEINLKIRPNCDMVLSPKATLTHFISPLDIEKAYSEIEAITQIHRCLNTPGTISLGYNTLSFDDEFLRFSFYRNLLPPYTHQYAHQCQRMDIYPMLLFFYLYKPDVLAHWPKIDGKTSLKLDQLNAANQLAPGRAHDAVVDVEATLALAKKLMQVGPMWQYLCGYFNKALDQKRSQELEAEGLMILGRFGAKDAYQAPVLALGPHRHYANQTIWLRLDLPELRQATLDNLDQKTQVLAKKWAEPGFLLPPTPERIAQLKPARRAEVQANKTWLAEHPLIWEGIRDYHCHRKYPVYEQTDIDAALYTQPFLKPAEQHLCAAFHQAEPDQKAQLLERFSNKNLQEQAIRLMGRHYPQHLPLAYQERFRAYLQRIWTLDKAQLLIDFRGQQRFGLLDAQAELEELRAHTPIPERERLLADLEAYYERARGVSGAF